jgi:hypothetical protein
MSGARGGWVAPSPGAPGTGTGGCFLGRPLPGPGRRVIGFIVGSFLRTVSPLGPVVSALC